MVAQEVLNRKGARKAQDIPEKVMALLNKGQIETVNLTEWLAVDHSWLIKNTFLELGPKPLLDSIMETIEQQKKPSTMGLTKLIGKMIYDYGTENRSLDSVFEKLANHTSDTIRGYATYLIALNVELDIHEKLNRSKKLIADTHFGVREIVWMALRPEIEMNLDESIEIL